MKPASFLFILVGFGSILFGPGALNAQAPPVFIPNKGQWPDAVQFRAETGGGALFVQRDALVWNFVEWPSYGDHVHGSPGQHADQRPTYDDLYQFDGPSEGEVIRGHAFRISFEGSSGSLQFKGSEPQPGTVNYFLGNDPAKWASGLTRYRRLEADYSAGMTLVLYESGGNIKYDMIVRPGADVSKFTLQYEGQDDLQIQEGSLHIKTSLNELVEMKPYAFQELNGRRVEVACRYRLKGNKLQFDFPDGYDASRTLVIDPATWIFGSYSGSTTDNWGYSATYDADGNLFGAGIVFGVGYPVTLGAYQTTFGGGAAGFGCDVGITKFSADGTTNLWSTYLGGNGNEFPFSMIANSNDELWVFGSTGSMNFPVTPGAFDAVFSAGTSVSVTGVNFPVGTDLYVSRLAADGTALLASTYVGGFGNDGLNLGTTVSFNYGDHARGEIILDAAEQPIIASCTNSTNFPISFTALQPTNGGGQDGVIFSLSEDASTLLWGTYFGGSNSDGVYSLKV